MPRGISSSWSARCRTRWPTTASRTRRPSSSSSLSATGVQATRRSGSRCATRRAPTSTPTARSANASQRPLSANRGVVAVLGPTVSTCASLMLPILNRAPAVRSRCSGIGNTYLGLTRDGPGVEDGDPERYRPSGDRSYLRTMPADDVQGAASVLAAREAGAQRVFAVHDGTQVRAGCRDGVHRGGGACRTRGRRYRAVGPGRVRLPRAGCSDRRNAAPTPSSSVVELRATGRVSSAICGAASGRTSCSWAPTGSTSPHRSSRAQASARRA